MIYSIQESNRISYFILECSCEPGCSIGNQSCCFESDVLKNQRDYFEEECHFLTTANIEHEGRHKIISYNMISKCSRYTRGQSSTNIPCGEENVAPWGSLFPVYSKSSAKIFKNNACALCNGVTDGIAWDALMICHVYTSDGALKLRMQNIANFESFLNGYNPDNLCYVNFKPQIPFSSLDHLRCLKDPISTCPNDDFSIPGGLSMTKDEVRQACSSGLTSYYTMFGSFKNVFCHICNKQAWPEKRACMSLLMYPRDDFLLKFSSLLTTDFLLKKYRAKRSNNKLPTACMETKGFQKVCFISVFKFIEIKMAFAKELWQNQRKHLEFFF